jgi:hypothetical protein
VAYLALPAPTSCAATLVDARHNAASIIEYFILISFLMIKTVHYLLLIDD